MPPRLARMIAAAAVGAALLAAGCGGKQQRPEVFPVRGVVTLDGRPVARARVSFENDSSRHWAEAFTNEAGEYSLWTFRGVDGAVPGAYVVSIVKDEDPANVPASVRDLPNYVPRNLLPDRYATAKTSGLSATVESRRDAGANRFDFKLASRGK